MTVTTLRLRMGVNPSSWPACIATMTCSGFFIELGANPEAITYFANR